MDAFYASVEQHDRPELRGRPLVVGGSERARGVVAAASYEARRFGIHSAMAMSRAFRLCPHLVRVSPRFDRYHEVSSRIHDVFTSYTDLAEPLSLDESFLDVTAFCLEHRRSAGSVALEIKHRIRERVGLTASAGAAPSKLVAKIASDLRKPDGLVIVAPQDVEAFLRPLAVERLWGVGPVTAGRLHAVGLRTIGDLADATPDRLEKILGRHGRDLHALARGVDDRPVQPRSDPKSLSAENTFAVDARDVHEVLAQLADQAAEVAGRLAGHGFHGRTVTLKVRYSDFTTVTRSQSLPRPVRTAEDVLAVATRMLLQRTEFPGRPIRLVGVGVAGLVDERGPQQLELPLWECEDCDASLA